MNEEQLKMFNSLSEKGKEEVLKRLNFEFMKEETRNRLKTEPAILEYFNKFREDSIPHFINMYANQKEHWITSGDTMKVHNFNFDYKFRDIATKGLQQILAKKLLIKMCEWSAGLIELEGVETSDDFHYWYQNIFNCPFLEPVTKEEISIYEKYLNGPDYDQYNTISIPWTYISVIRNYDKTEYTGEPEFSILYDTYMGTTGKWLLPNIKVAKEETYKKVANDERIRKYYKDVEDGIIPPHKVDSRPSLDYPYENIYEEFVRKFESPQLLELLRSYYKFSNDHCHYDENGDMIPAPKDTNVNEKVMEAMNTIYEDYLFRHENSLGFERNEENIKKFEQTTINGKNQIIEGRKLLGEPDNLDIY